MAQNTLLRSPFKSPVSKRLKDLMRWFVVGVALHFYIFSPTLCASLWMRGRVAILREGREKGRTREVAEFLLLIV